MTRFAKKILKYSVAIALIVIYMNILAFLVPYFDLEYTVFEYIFMVFVFVLAIITSEFIFRGKQ